MSTARPTNRRILRRRHQRGAAMVEGIVVMTTMLVFLGMNVWAENVYGGKLDQANSTRRDVLYYASHACENQNGADPDTYTQPQLRGIAGPARAAEATGVPPANSDLDTRAGGLNDTAVGGGGLNGAVERSWNSASGGKGGTSITGSVLVGQNSILVSRTPLVATVTTNSYVTCNEKAYNNQWTAFFEFGWDFLKTLGGAPG